MPAWWRRDNRSPTVTLIVWINIAVFLAWSFSSEVAPAFMVENFLVSWDAIVEGRFWTLLTSVFSHNMLLHILINMMVLRSFGTVLEIVLGTKQFLAFYLAAGVISSACHALVSAFVMGDPSLPALGASGAIAGLVLVFSLIFPKEKILLLGFIPMPALLGALAFVGLDIWGLVAQAGGGGLPIGHGAHLGGALTGFLYYLFYLRPRLRVPAD